MAETALITGGASGIGAALGSALVRRGADVVLADIDHERGTLIAKTLTQAGPGHAEAVDLDVRDPHAVADVLAQTHRAYGRLDYLFNNAGIGVGGEPDELLLDHWNRAIDVNLKGVIHGCHAAYPLMTEQGFGHIVNTASLAGLAPVPGWLAPYSTTKFAVVGLSLALRAALADSGVQVHAVCPGFIDTPILDKKGPEDLPIPPSVANSPTLRANLATFKIKAYPADRLAEDVLTAIAKNSPIITAPRSAHIQWLLWRLAPRVSLQYSKKMTRLFRDVRESDVREARQTRSPQSPDPNGDPTRVADGDRVWPEMSEGRSRGLQAVLTR
jgi:NAD(P)-dependent dehydrogenase (short-subunit alcohol dehydrogenase family)